MLTQLNSPPMSKNVSVSSWFFNQNFNGVADDFFDESLGFDDALKLFDFPLEPIEEKSVVENWDAEFKGLELPSPDALASLSSTFYSRGCSESKKMSASNENFKVKQERDVHESNSNCCSSKGQGSSCVFQSCSPDSVLERNMSAHPFPFDFKIVVPVKRRSKRPWNSGTGKEKKGNLSGTEEAITLQEREEEIRKCTHCEATQTPQWREGPMGPKTLCNACGVRYRSGRLFPEYRPLASPTFIESVHSNSHRKVAELRNKGTTTTTTTTRLAS